MTRWERMRWRWQQIVCAYRHGNSHGVIYVGQNRITVFCRTCGAESCGVDLETRRIRTIWMFERQRILWRTLRRHRTAS